MGPVQNPNQVYDHAQVLDLLQRYWGYDTLRPLQADAIRAGVEGRDSLLVLPTGGGKSLCYQIPPLVTNRLHVVVSPLISLMKDQVDGLVANGYPAAALHSNVDGPERRAIHHALDRHELRLLFVSPERLAAPNFLENLRGLDVGAFAVDEAHCISHWGHDFRPEYRRLASLRDTFPDAALHACTATATERVRDDIVEQLGLRDPIRLVGTFDRPNLTYRVVPMLNLHAQIVEVLHRHRDEGAIVYCLSRKDTETIAGVLHERGFRAAPYHAGMDANDRNRVQEAFLREELDVVVATVAFGMGIDRSNVRCVVHAAMPKSIEHYQQETGRAGRDGLPAECVLFYTYGDAARWERLLTKSAREAGLPETDLGLQASLELLREMTNFCGSAQCRHRALTRYFGQRYEKDDCGACDVCLDEVATLEDSTTVAQKILSGVARTRQMFGVGYVVQVLRGADTADIRRRGHDRLSTYGLLSDWPDAALTNLVYQLVDQGVLDRTPGDRPVLKLNDESWALLKGERSVRLVEPAGLKSEKTAAAIDEIEYDEGLFTHLRALRREIAKERDVPAYVVFGDRTLRELAARRPTSPSAMQSISGVGEAKLADLGPRFAEAIAAYCEQHDLSTTGGRESSFVSFTKPKASRNDSKERAEALFERGMTVAEVAAEVERAESTTWGYLAEWVARSAPASIDPWVSPETQERIREAARDAGGDGRLKPIHEALGAEVPYEQIRLTLAHWGVTGGE